MRVSVDNCQIKGTRDANNFKSAFNKRGALAKPLIASILTALILVVGVADVMGDPYVSHNRDSGTIGVLTTPTTSSAPKSTTVVILGIGLVVLAGADVRRRWKRKQLVKVG
ncbi:MAG: hypothetical protein GY775_20150 [Candidatus Scalindua sp.]|nr:hypothetical protein [Candidatus Scalindua sp.]